MKKQEKTKKINRIEGKNSFTVFGIQQIIEKGKENKEFMKMIYEYLSDNANNHILNRYLKFCLKEKLFYSKTNKKWNSVA